MVYHAFPTRGEPIVLVGHVHAFPRHPAPGAAIGPLVSGYEVRAAEHHPDVLYALVSVDWACKYTSIDLDTGASTTEYREGFLGTPTGRTWYLSPAAFDDTTAQYRLNNRQLARGSRDAQLPVELAGALGAPETVPIHDFPV